ncbi:DUF305 domain-containing protein [Kribbella sp. NPDC023855]|uniref:DUF305 domain-containing protein n=1 Tax=Kribbella sp. NPDC023855 TaxID=3154698 RepID=UPI0033F84738
MTSTLLLVVAACGSTVAASPPPPTAGTTAPASFNATDLAWIQLMIPMDEQLLRVLELARKQASTTALRTLATQLRAGHRAELAQLIALRTRAGAPTTNQHEGHDMPGMMTEAEVVALGKASGVAFDNLFVRSLKEHLKQSIVLAQGIGTAGQEPAVKKLAGSIAASRADQVAALGRAAVRTQK